jgi:hypothetical protein
MIGLGTDPHYRGVLRDVPPYKQDLRRDGGWWGTQEWLVRAEFSAPDHADRLRDEPKVRKALHALAGKSPGVDADLRPARFEYDQAVIPIGADPNFAVDPDYLLYAAATAGVEEWRWIADVQLKHETAGVLAGVKNGALVAVVAPIKAVTNSASDVAA